jgi:Outer membrane protein beta-barrel family/Carboxypeptidase regulatory-like domain
MRTNYTFSRLFIFVLFFFLYQSIQAQISAVVFNEKEMPLAFANVLLLKASDTSLIKGAITENNGLFRIDDVNDGTYLLEISMIGFQTYRSTVFEVKNKKPTKELGNLVIKENVALLEAVDVVAKKPLFEQKIDRMLINVENSITAAGATALEILERSPGVVVNRQNNTIAMTGKEGVIVMMNGKINRMPISAVVQLLAGMPSNNIKRIELITTPPANFDAEGNAGFINIVLKQSQDLGLNGAYSLTGGFGKGSILAGGINFNYRKKNFNLYGDYSYNRRNQEFTTSMDREVQLNGETIRTLLESVRNPSAQRNHNLRLGVDLELTKKTILGVLISGYDNQYNQLGITQSAQSRNGITDTLLNIKVDEINHWQHLAGNLNLQHTFNDSESLTFDVDYLYYYNNQPANYYTSYLDGSNKFLFQEQSSSGKLTPINVGVSSLNYSKRFSEAVKMDLGVKGTLSQFDNDVTAAMIKNGIQVKDPSLTAKYRLEESIFAAFSSFDVKLDDKTSMKLGLRYEYTNSNLGTKEQANIVDRHYGRLFPSFYLARTFNENHAANISFGRRITRPTFNDLAPFVFFVDPNTFLSGNAALQPSLSNSLKLDYRFKSTLISVLYSVEDSTISLFQPKVITGTQKVIYAAQNMKNRKSAALVFALPITLTKWWNMQNNLIGTWQEVNAYFDKNLIQVHNQNLQLVWINNFTLPKNFSAEMVGVYQTKALSGAAVTLPYGTLNIGIQKKFKDNLGTLRFGIDDVLNSAKLRFGNNLPQYNVVSTVVLDFSQRTFKLSYSRNFGNNQLKGNRQRATGAEEERGRVTN